MGGIAAGWGLAVAVPASTPETAWFVFAAGACASAAMILPGVSGAYVLVLLKKYAYMLAALGRLDLAVLVPFGLGVAAGLVLLSRALGWLLGRFRRPTLFALAGLVAGSLWSLWPYRLAMAERSVPAWPETLDPVSLLLSVSEWRWWRHSISPRGFVPDSLWIRATVGSDKSRRTEAQPR